MRSRNVIVIVEVYLFLTLAFFIFGPLTWSCTNLSILIAYVSALFVFLFLGFRFYLFTKRNSMIKTQNNHNEYAISEKRVVKALKIMLVFNLIVFILYLIRNSGNNRLTMQNILIWIQNPSAQYSEKFNNNYGVFGTIVAYLSTFSSFFLWPTIPLGIYYFRKLKTIYKLILIANVIVEALRWLVMGTNKGLVDLLLVFSCLFILFLKAPKIKMKSKIVLAIFVALAVFFVGFYFSNNVSGRVSNNSTYLMNNLTGATIDNNNFLFRLFPNAKNLVLYSNSYLCQGYYGLSLGLNQEWTPMFGLGNSVFLRENIEELFDVELFQYTFMHKINYLGWSEKSNWHTAFLWFANDFGFIGTLLLMLLIGYYFGFICYNLFDKGNGLFFPLFCIMIEMFFYFPMNNQIFNMPFSFMGFFGMNVFLLIISFSNKKKKEWGRGNCENRILC